MYDHVVPYRDRGDLDFYVGLAKKYGGTVLELGCGTGRVLIPTARAGIHITGLDGSERMLDVCRRKLAQEPGDVQSRVALVSADMRNFDLGRRFKLVTVPFRPFQHLLTTNDQLACLACIRRHLADDGRFVLDVFNPDVSKLIPGDEGDEEPPFEMPDGRTVVRRNKVESVDEDRQLLDAQLIYYVTHPDGREERLVDAFPFRYFFQDEMESLLASAGFQIEALYGDFDGRPVSAERLRELIFISHRAP